jgi:crotonobetainyl-CoA:carnitine CoA-transferase CaiB-like acyl-CoA transferase
VSGPLAGIRVFDLTQWMVGPWGSMQLGSLGADIIHIEQPDVDWATLGAGVPPTINGTSVGYISWNMNKRAFSLDLKSPEYRARAHELLKTCDVFLINMRPGVAERLGFSYETVSGINPRVVYCTITGWGETGPMSELPGADTQVQYVTGLPSSNGVEGGPPEVYRHFTQMDATTGNYAAQAILMALLARERTGRGQRIHLSMLRAGTALQTERLGEYFVSGVLPAPRGSASQATAPDQAFECEDHEWIGVAVTSEAEWAAFCEAIKHSELVGDDRFRTNAARLDHRYALVEILTPIFQSRPRDHWMFYLERASVPCGFPMRWDVLRHHRQVRENEYLVDVETAAWGPVTTGGPPWHLELTPATWTGTPFPGQHDREILAEIDAAPGQNVPGILMTKGADHGDG